MLPITTKTAFLGSGLAVGILLSLGNATPTYASHIVTKKPPISGLVFPEMNPEKGKELFVSKGCVTCHSINGVGGDDAPALDDHKDMTGVNPFDFVARMWNHATGMIAAQEEELDGQIHLTGDDMANIVAFVHDHAVQHSFSEKDLTPQLRKMMAKMREGGDDAKKAKHVD